MQPLSAGPEGTRDEATSPRGGPGMAERAGLLPLAAAAGGLFKNRQTPQGGAVGAPTERGFQKISGRKLPSAFSEGMTAGPSRPVPMPAAFENGRNLSNASFWRDSTGFYGGTGNGSSGEQVHELDGHGPTELQQGPARTPMLHPGGPYIMSPGETPPMSPRAGLLQGRAATPVNVPLSPTGTAGRSETPATMASHGSRFTEEV